MDLEEEEEDVTIQNPKSHRKGFCIVTSSSSSSRSMYETSPEP
jgi:hypothetical protein